MHDEPLWLEPDYFESFQCKCGECRACCCNGWDIAVNQEEYFRLIGLDCSEELHHRLECAFYTPKNVSPQHFRLISPNWLGECPMRDKDGLCLLQKEGGEAALPEVCRVYPRSLRRENRHLIACCTCGCEAVVEQLMKQERVGFRFRRLNVQPEIIESMDEEMLGLGLECIMAFQDRSLPLRDRVRAVCSRVDGGAEALPEGQDGLDCLLFIMREIYSSSIKPFCSGMEEKYADPQAYQRDICAFEARFPQWERWFENLLVNHLLCMVFPHMDVRLSVPDAAKGFAACFALLRVICAFHGAEHKREQDMADAISAVFRTVEHSSFYYNCNILVSDWQALTGL